MSSFLDDLGRELDRAALRRRRPRPAWPALAAAAVAAVIAIVVLSGGNEPERTVPTPAADAPQPFRFPPPPAALKGVEVALAGPDDEPFAPELVARNLAASGWATTPAFGNRLTVHDAPPGLRVVYGTATRTQAEAAAGALRIDDVRPAPPELADRGVTIVIGRHGIFPAALAAYRRDYAVLGPDGEGVAQTADGRARVYVSGGDLCVFFHGGGTCAFAEAVPRDVLTTENEAGDIHEAIGVVPDGVDHVTLSTGERVLVRDNVWTVGRTDATYADIPGVGRTRVF